MADSDAIIKAATELGGLLKEHQPVKELKAAAKAFADDVTVQRAMVDFQRALQDVSRKEQSGQPVEVADKRRLQELQDAVVSNPQLQRMQVAQMDCVDLLRKIDAAMTAEAGLDEAAMTPPGASPAPAGGAGGLGGGGGVFGG